MRSAFLGVRGPVILNRHGASRFTLRCEEHVDPGLAVAPIETTDFGFRARSSALGSQRPRSDPSANAS